MDTCLPALTESVEDRNFVRRSVQFYKILPSLNVLHYATDVCVTLHLVCRRNTVNLGLRQFWFRALRLGDLEENRRYCAQGSKDGNYRKAYNDTWLNRGKQLVMIFTFCLHRRLQAALSFLCHSSCRWFPKLSAILQNIVFISIYVYYSFKQPLNC